MRFVGIVGSGADKFTTASAEAARKTIRGIVASAIAKHGAVTVVSGHSPAGGVDLWAEEAASEAGAGKLIFAPLVFRWGEDSDVYGYKARNVDIANASDEVHVVLAREYPRGYGGTRFGSCYHHEPPSTDHVKSGACWTANLAKQRRKSVLWYVI